MQRSDMPVAGLGDQLLARALILIGDLIGLGERVEPDDGLCPPQSLAVGISHSMAVV